MQVVDVWADASPEGWGVRIGQRSEWAPWRPSERGLHIFYLELLAAAYGILMAVDGAEGVPVVIKYMGDNEAGMRVWQRGHSSRRAGNAVVGPVLRELRERGCFLDTVWVPTGEQKADDLTRAALRDDGRWQSPGADRLRARGDHLFSLDGMRWNRSGRGASSRKRRRLNEAQMPAGI
eukprot:Sspe_Gene.79446::Locus_49830_Transcript_1_1_Confidence_1.000_Length_949::g.79446::m.79446